MTQKAETNVAPKVAIVTGTSRGIGAAIAERLARDGMTVIVNYSGSAAPAEALVEKIEKAGGRARAHQADVGAGIMQMAPIAENDDKFLDSHIAVDGSWINGQLLRANGGAI